jgi:hypothetical protein
MKIGVSWIGGIDCRYKCEENVSDVYYGIVMIFYLCYQMGIFLYIII